MSTRVSWDVENPFTPGPAEQADVDALATVIGAAQAGAVALRGWATTGLAGEWAEHPVLVCGDLDDTAITQLPYGPPGSQYGAGGPDRPDRGEPPAAVGHRLPDVPAGRLVAHRPGPTGAHRPRPRLPRDDRRAARGPHAPSRRAQRRRRPQLAPRATGEPPSDHRPVRARSDLWPPDGRRWQRRRRAPVPRTRIPGQSDNTCVIDPTGAA